MNESCFTRCPEVVATPVGFLGVPPVIDAVLGLPIEFARIRGPQPGRICVLVNYSLAAFACRARQWTL